MTDERYRIECEARRSGSGLYRSSDEEGIVFSYKIVRENGISRIYHICLSNSRSEDFCGVIHVKALMPADDPLFFMPGYMYGSNTAEMPSSGRKAFPRLKKNAESRPESPFFMTRSDRLAEPVSMIYDNGTVMGISADPCLYDDNRMFIQFNGFSCSIDDNGSSSVGYTIGYENAP